MIEQQKQLLADLQAAGATALKLYNKGVKIPGIVQKIREAASELENRVRFIEKNAPVVPRAARPKAVVADK